VSQELGDLNAAGLGEALVVRFGLSRKLISRVDKFVVLLRERLLKSRRLFRFDAQVFRIIRRLRKTLGVGNFEILLAFCERLKFRDSAISLLASVRFPLLRDLVGPVNSTGAFLASPGFVSTNASTVRTIEGNSYHLCRESTTVWNPNSFLGSKKFSPGPPRSRLSFVLSTGDASQSPLPLSPLAGLDLEDGFQDPRVFSIGSQLFALASRLVLNNRGEQVWTQYMLELGAGGTCVTRSVPVSYQGQSESEKNWMPLVHSDELPALVVRQVSPTSTLEIGREGEIEEAVRDGPPDLSCARGGTALFPIGQKWVAIVHHTYTSPLRYYSHRIVEFRKEGRGLAVSRFSREFFLQDVARLEFATGLTFEGEEAHIFLGWEECESIKLTCESKSLLGLLE
jgi:hypothetical protein